MDLDSQAKELLDLGIVTDPAITTWEASFDDGASYVAGTPVTGGCTWLIAGEDCGDQSDAVAVITKSIKPKVRAVDNPEIIVRRAPLIRYQS